jgi:large subunit ribosomal protein L10
MGYNHKRLPVLGAVKSFLFLWRRTSWKEVDYNMVIRPEKVAMIADYKAALSTAKGVVLADFRGIKVSQDTKLRRKMREAGIQYSVIKNNMASIAAKEAGIEGLDDFLKGPLAMVSSAKDPVAPAKLISEFAKENKILEIKGGLVEGKVIGPDAVRALAMLPSREVLLAKALGSMQAPIVGLVNVLHGNLRKLVCALDAVRQQKESA